MRKSFLSEQASYLLYRAGWTVIGSLPRPIAALLMRGVADLASSGGRGMEQLRRNLQRVVGKENVSRLLVRDAMRSYFRYWMEAFRLSRVVVDRHFLARFSKGISGLEHLDAALETGKGVILVLPHSGNWDLAGAWLAQNYGVFTTVSERLKPERLYNAFVQFREGLGFEVLPNRGGEVPVMQVLVERLQENGIVCLLGDRDLSGTGVEVDFFGEATTFPAGPAALAKQTGAKLLPVHCAFGGSLLRPGWRLVVLPPVAHGTIGSMTQEIADCFSQQIRRFPQDWHVLQPLWIADRSR